MSPMLGEPRVMGNGEERGVGTCVPGGAPVLEQQEHQPGPGGWERGKGVCGLKDLGMKESSIWVDLQVPGGQGRFCVTRAQTKKL